MILPKNIKTPEICFESVQRYRWALPYVPGRFRTRELCLAAVQKSVDALSYVPEHLKTLEFYLEAALFSHVPKELRTPEVTLAAIRKKVLSYVPDELRTPELCLAAVQQSAWALYHVPEELKTSEICLAAVQQAGRALEYVPEELRTPEFYLAAIQKNGKALPYVPVELRTFEICLAAVQQDGRALEYVPDEFRTTELCLAAVQQSGWAIESVPKELQTQELYFAAGQASGWAIRFGSEASRTPERCLAAVQENGMAFMHVPKYLQTPELARVAFLDVAKRGDIYPHFIKRSVLASREKMESLEPADFDASIEAALEVYQMAKLNKPSLILRMGSPYGAMLGCALAIKLFRREESEKNNLPELPFVYEIGLHHFRKHVMPIVTKLVARHAPWQVCDPQWYFGPWWYLFNCVYGPWRNDDYGWVANVWPFYWSRMEHHEEKEFGNRVFDQVISQAMQQTEIWTESQVVHYLADNGWDFSNDSGNLSWADWRSFVSFFRDVSEQENGILERFDIDEVLAYSCGDVWWHENVLVISDRPVEIHKDAEGRFHNATGPSISYRDGWSLYYWHGVPIPGKWVTGNPPSVREALTWKNTEQKGAAFEIIGLKGILKELNVRVIDDDPEIGVLLEAALPLRYGRVSERFLKFRRRTDREFVHVPRYLNLDTALEAYVWKRDGKWPKGSTQRMKP